jgi:hypothetical protein
VSCEDAKQPEGESKITSQWSFFFHEEGINIISLLSTSLHDIFTSQEMDVSYSFGHIQKHTEKMVKVFNAGIHDLCKEGDAAAFVPYIREHQVSSDVDVITWGRVDEDQFVRAIVSGWLILHFLKRGRCCDFVYYVIFFEILTYPVYMRASGVLIVWAEEMRR